MNNVTIAQALQLAFDRHRAGDLVSAEGVYQKILGVAPGNADALHLLGVLSTQRKEYDKAAALISQATLLGPPNPIYLTNLGVAYAEMGLRDKAIDLYRQAIKVDSNYADAHNNLANNLAAQGDLKEAIQSYRRAIELNPHSFEVFSNLGGLLAEIGQIEESIASLNAAVQINPNDGLTQYRLGVALQQGNDPHGAMCMYDRALALCDTPENKIRVGMMLGTFIAAEDHPLYRALLKNAILQAWTHPSRFVRAAFSLLVLNPGSASAFQNANAAWLGESCMGEIYSKSELRALAKDDLLRCLLENTTANQPVLEYLLTRVRADILKAVRRENEITEYSDIDISFYCAVAKQCFINEYVYLESDEEAILVAELKSRVELELAEKAPVAALPLIVLSAYLPLYTLSDPEALLQISWPPFVDELITQQIREPLQERYLAQRIPRLTNIEGAVSTLVRIQYEENPYPRWIKSPLCQAPEPINVFVQKQLPRARFRHMNKKGIVDILIAGCGTGQHPIQTAQSILDVNVLAIDLSLASLAYALRKTEELGLSNVEYGQADIMDLGSLSRKFDVIESVGVLHHMDSPSAGLSVLASLLQTGGFMCLGLYSEMGRRDVVVARKLIKERGYAANQQDIRRCRHEILNTDTENAKCLYSRRDFYSTSGCRDLIFHSQEHRFTLPQIYDLLAQLGLTLLGFTIDQKILKNYLIEYPDDPSAVNLRNWSEFESRYPETFSGMYQFWVQKGVAGN